MVRKYSYRRKKPSYRRKRITYRRKRFSKKKFARNNRGILTQRAMLASNNLNIKLPWVKTITASVAGGYSPSYVFVGNGIAPYSPEGSSHISPPAGEPVAAGILEYSLLYNNYICYGSSIKIEVSNTSGSTGASTATQFRAVLFAVPYSGLDDNDDIDDTISQLNGYTYEQLLSWPSAKWKIVGQSTGGNGVKYFKMFRKTKSMIGVKDLRDQRYTQSITTYLPDGGASTGTVRNPETGFMYYFRLFNLNPTNSQDVYITVRMKLYLGLSQREFNPVAIIKN